MRHLDSPLRTAAAALALCGLLLAAACSPAPPSRETVADPEELRLLALRIESTATALYLSDATKYDEIVELLASSVNRLDPASGEKHDPLAPRKETPPPDDATWGGLATIRLLALNLQIVAQERFRADPSLYEETEQVLSDTLVQLEARSICNCPNGAPFCCCGACQARKCEVGQCLQPPDPVVSGP